MDAKQINSKQVLPPFGKFLVSRRSFNNDPDRVHVQVGGDAYQLAKNLNKCRDIAALVLPPGHHPNNFKWPVAGLRCVVDWDGSVPCQLIENLIVCLLKAGALLVAVFPTWVDTSTPAECFDTSSQSWIELRESMKIYYPKAVKNVSN
ncbi:MAG: hypothetical protein ACXV79_10685 [Methylobacter sp.]